MTSSIRLARETDARAVRDIYAPIVENTAISFDSAPPSEDVIAGRMRATLAAHPWLVAERDGHVLGYAYGSPFRSREDYRLSFVKPVGPSGTTTGTLACPLP